MERSEFFRKLIRSLFIITAVAALSLALSGRSKSACNTATDCANCQKGCTLQTKK